MDSKYIDSGETVQSLLDRKIQLRVKEFLKLPSIGGIQDAPKTPLDDVDDHETEELRKKSVTKALGETTTKSWKDLIHCRYLRLNGNHDENEKVSRHNACQCNWCSKMRKQKI